MNKQHQVDDPSPPVLLVNTSINKEQPITEGQHNMSMKNDYTPEQATSESEVADLSPPAQMNASISKEQPITVDQHEMSMRIDSTYKQEMPTASTLNSVPSDLIFPPLKETNKEQQKMIKNKPKVYVKIDSTQEQKKPPSVKAGGSIF